MPEFFLDGEPVRFDGPVPHAYSELLAVVHQSVSASGRVLAGVHLDGRPVEGEVDDAIYGAANRIELVTITIAEAIRHVRGSCRQRAAELRERLAAQSADVLREPWTSVAPRILDSGAPLASLLHDIASLGETSPYVAWARELEAALNRWVDAVSARDAAAVCLAVECSVLPCLTRVAEEAGEHAEA